MVARRPAQRPVCVAVLASGAAVPAGEIPSPAGKRSGEQSSLACPNTVCLPLCCLHALRLLTQGQYIALGKALPGQLRPMFESGENGPIFAQHVSWVNRTK